MDGLAQEHLRIPRTPIPLERTTSALDTAKKSVLQIFSGLFVRDKGFYKTVTMLALPIVLQNMITMGVNIMDRLTFDARLVLGVTDAYVESDDAESSWLVLDGSKLMSFKFGVGFWIL